MLKSLRFIVAVLFLLMLVAGVVSAQDEKILVIGWEQEPPKLSPWADNTFGSLIDGFVRRDVWDWDVNRDIYPVMVEEVPTLENGGVETLDNGNTRVTVKLREDLVWSDGEPVTSDDCLIWHEVMIDPTKGAVQRENYPDVVESFEVVDDYTVTITYNKPWPDYTFDSEVQCGRLPAHIFRPILEADGNIDNAPFGSGEGVVGYGPYLFDEWTIGSQISLSKNPNWDGEPAKFDKVILRFITDSAQMLNALEAGEVDVTFNWSDDLVDSYSAIEGVEVFKTDGVYGDAVWMNVGNYKGLQEAHPILGDAKVREAIITAIDRVALAEELVAPGVGVPKSWTPAQFWAEDLPYWDYDEAKANELLDEAGWVDTNDNGTRDKDGMELVLRFYTTTRQIRMDYQVVIQEYLSKVGVGVQLLPIPSNILFASFNDRGILDTGDFDLALFALSSNPLSPAFAAPDWFGCGSTPTAELPTGKNGWGACSEAFDEADLAVSTTIDPAERMELAGEAQKAFFDMGFWHGLYLRPTWYAVSTAVVNVDEEVQNLGTLSQNYFNHVEYWQPAE
ncbi:MAG TPA: peptide ABC transporter substrate-binding protein [Phototrophicaceae bacterium]|nr:peptide ABC transporter substrate-binding protein [Phototrophicaceae bacterium]